MNKMDEFLLFKLIYLLISYSNFCETLNSVPKSAVNLQLVQKRFPNSPLLDEPKTRRFDEFPITPITPIITYYPLERPIVHQINEPPKLIFIPINGMMIPPTLINLNDERKVKQWPKYMVPKKKVRNYSLFSPYRSSINSPKYGHYFGQPRDNSHSNDYFDRERTPEEIESSETHPFYMVNAYIADWVSRFNRLEYDYGKNPDQEKRKGLTMLLKAVLHPVGNHLDEL